MVLKDMADMVSSSEYLLIQRASEYVDSNFKFYHYDYIYTYMALGPYPVPLVNIPHITKIVFVGRFAYPLFDSWL